MPTKSKRSRQSKAALAVDLQSHNRTICDRIQSLRDTAVSVLEATAPTKRQRKMLLDTADSLLLLQGDVEAKIPELVPKDCSKYSIARLRADSNQAAKTQSGAAAPRENMRARTFSIAGDEYSLPENRIIFTASEACEILAEVEDSAATSITKAIRAMLHYSPSSFDEERSLIPCGISTMHALYKKYKTNVDVQWARMGRRPILTSSSLLEKIGKFEEDEARAVGKVDLKNILKAEVEDKATDKGNSALTVVTPTKRSMFNYMALLPQLDPDRVKTEKVQKKSEARYIAERSFRNAVSHVFSVSISHYQIGTPDIRFKKIDKASSGAQKLYKLIQKENNGADLQVVMPFFLSTTDDTTVFAFEGAVDGKSDRFIINKNNDSGTRSTYTQNTSSTDSMRGIRIRHSVSFNAVGNAAPFYTTLYGLTEEELPTATCLDGVFTIPIPGYCYGGAQDCSSSAEGYLVFLRNTNKENEMSTDQINHIKYRNNVFLPWIDRTREHYLRHEGFQRGDAVENEYTWVSWMVCTCQTN